MAVEKSLQSACRHGTRWDLCCKRCGADEDRAAIDVVAEQPAYPPGGVLWQPPEAGCGVKVFPERDPNGTSAKAPGAKLDAGKAPVRRGLLEYFPRACLAVATVSGFGADKYSWGGWVSVPQGVDRYGDAEVRHICKAAIEGPLDAESELMHAAHEAWNAMARLELMMREQEATGASNPG